MLLAHKGLNVNWSRNGHDITARFPELGDLHKLVAPYVIDCEHVVLDDETSGGLNRCTKRLQDWDNLPV